MESKLTLTVSDVAELLGVSKPVVYQLCKSKGFPAIHVGKKILVNRSKLQSWLDDASERGDVLGGW